MNSIIYLVDTLFSLYMLVVMLRMWLQYCKADFYNPISQSVVKVTNPALNPLRKLFKAKKGIDVAALVFTFLLGMLKYPLLMLLSGDISIESIFVNLSVWTAIGLLSILKTFGEMLLYVIFLRAILSWFRRGQDPLSALLFQLGEPVLNPIRRILPRTAMLDFSPMVLAFILFFLDRLMFDIAPDIWQVV